MNPRHPHPVVTAMFVEQRLRPILASCDRIETEADTLRVGDEVTVQGGDGTVLTITHIHQGEARILDPHGGGWGWHSLLRLDRTYTSAEPVRRVHAEVAATRRAADRHDLLNAQRGIAAAEAALRVLTHSRA